MKNNMKKEKEAIESFKNDSDRVCATPKALVSYRPLFDAICQRFSGVDLSHRNADVLTPVEVLRSFPAKPHLEKIIEYLSKQVSQ